MNVASLELCKELYGLSQWGVDSRTRHFSHFDGSIAYGWIPETIPAYDLGYLLRKLPTQVRVLRHTDELTDPSVPVDSRAAHWRVLFDTADDKHYWLSADTPEDAAAKLAIELFKQGVLTRGGDAEE